MLDPAERRKLKTRAHRLEPVVTIGAKGLTDEVVKEIEMALKAHELVKVRAAALAREQREPAFREILSRTHAQFVQQVGKVLVLYRKNDAPR